MGAVTEVCCSSQPKKQETINPKPEANKEKLKDKSQNQSSTPPTNNVVTTPKSKREVPPQKPDQTKQDMQLFIKNMEEKFPAPNSKINWESFYISHRIGSGGFGQVFLGELLSNRTQGIVQKYAIKRIPKLQIQKRKLTSSIQLQKKILQESKSHFITTLHYAFRDAKYLYLVMEFASGGDTYTLINQKSSRIQLFKSSGETAVRFILACLIMGMEYLHNHNIMYRDLKPQNVLMFQDGYVKLTDFGLAKEIDEDKLSKTQAGTTIYYAPEMVLRQGYSKYIDLWTIGIFAYEMSNYNPPFAGSEIKDRHRVKKIVLNAQKNRVWKNPNLSEQLKDFINSLLKFDPKQRLGYTSWAQIKNHAFFTSAKFSWQDLQSRKIPSPLKSLIDHYPMQYKQYAASQQKANLNSSGALNQDFPGWTCVNKDQK